METFPRLMDTFITATDDFTFVTRDYWDRGIKRDNLRR